MAQPRFFKVSGNIIDVLNREIYPGTLEIADGHISRIMRGPVAETQYLLPGFIDAHVHVESSMLVPSEFARLAVPHGTVATVSDPHEIGNVLGLKGVEYMLENGKKVPFKFYFGAPSCVPATPFETAGAEITPEDIEELFLRPEVKYLAEMMNWPGVLNQDELVMRKITLAQKFDKQIDGHAPGLMGEQAQAYAAAGMTTDHECFTAPEARDKLAAGMKILIREGSAAKNFEALIELLSEFPDKIMFCSDDKHPDNLVESHINELVKRALAKGHDLFHVLQAACVNPVQHYKLEVGLLQEKDPADFIVIDNLEQFNVLQTYINGQLVAEDGKSKIEFTPSEIVNNFHAQRKTVEQFHLSAPQGLAKLRVIEPYDGQLITGMLLLDAKVENGNVVSDVAQDVLKMAVVNRYQNTEPAIAFIKNFGLQRGAIASSVGHDSHNIIAVGCDDESLCRAVNLLIDAQGGISAVADDREEVLPLPVAGIMSAEDGYWVAEQYAQLDQAAKDLGSTLTSPFMTLSFMALLVIPALKLSDKGLFDGQHFQFIEVLVGNE
ncbi:adenine deaminase [Rufibacter ruber]|uniref:adenine deaminase n=1 Tax=Rufibacter ruber TaxID=1783499 RepID=UPI0008297ED7|nr:adenine deaminase [Rufibacter ruber]